MSSLSGHSSMSEISSREMPTSESDEENERDDFENEEEDSEFEDDNVKTAKPPDGVGKGSHTVAAADILEYVDQLIESNTISSERGQRLKRKYNALVDSIEMSRTAENTLLMKTRELQLELSSDLQTLEKADGFPESYSTEISQLRQIQLQHENELKQSEEIGLQLDREIEKLEEEYKQTRLEYDHMPKKEDIEEKILELKKEIEGVREEIAERNVDSEKLKDARKLKESKCESIRDEVNQLKSVQTSLKDEFVTLTIAPASTPREMDKIRKAISETNERINESKQTTNELIEEIQRQAVRSDHLTEQLSTLKNDYDEERRRIDAKQVGSDSLAKNILSGKEHESTLIEEEASLDLQKKLKFQEHKHLYESFIAKSKEKDKELKQLKRADVQLRTAYSGIEQQGRLLEPIIRKSEEATEVNKRRKETLNSVKQDVEALRKTVAQQVGYEHVEQRYLSMHIDKERHYREQSRKALDVLGDIGKDVVAMTRQRDSRSREYYKTIRELHDVEYEEKIKKNLIEDQEKKLRDLDMNLREFAEAYKVVKNERNKAYSQIQTCQQLSAEMKEKMKVLQNESEILQNAVDSKSKVLVRAQLAFISKNQDRDTQHQEIGRVRAHQNETQNDLERQREVLHKLTQQINAMEQMLNKLRLRYENSVQDRNDTGLQLIERNEEVCVFHEKLNVQDSVCRKGNMQMMERVEEIRFLNMEIAKLNRELNVSKKTLTEAEGQGRDLTRTQNQLLSTREVIKQLEVKVTDANNPERLRLLKGEDPSCSELREKVEKLQVRLTDQEQKVLEKELLLEQVYRLADRLKKKVDTRRHVTLQVGNKVNNYQSKLTDGTKKMMALVSELSLQQALTIRLQQEVNEKEAQLEQAYSRLDSGEAPDEASAKEWTRMLQINELSVNRNIEQSPEEGRELPNGVYTMAEPRPNAYIPESEIELPLPKPYGAHAPFKPSQLGANMRHIRKPQPQVIDI